MQNKNVYKKLMEVQAELKAPKNQRNDFGKYNYRNAEDILEAVKPLLKKEGLVINISDDIVLIGDRYYVKATAKVIDIETGESIESVGLAREDIDKKGQDLAMITGSCSSYSRKYALNGLLAIDSSELDPDKTHTFNKDDSKQYNNSNNSYSTRKYPISDEMVEALYQKAEKAGYTRDVAKSHILKKFNKSDLNWLSKAEYNQACEGYDNIKK